jgi:hypothetical protein
VDYSEESFIKVHQRRTTSLAVVGWAARAVLVEMRCRCDSFGIIEVGSEDPADAITALLGDIPAETVRDSLERLCRRGEVRIGGGKVLIVEHQAIQEARKSPKARAVDYRAKKRAEALASVGIPIFDQNSVACAFVTDESQPVTEPSRKVTKPSRVITPRHDQIRSDQISPPNPPVLNPEAPPAQRTPIETHSEATKPESTPSAPNPENPETNLSEPHPRHQRLEDLPIAELCRKVQENPHNASFVNLAERPEIARINARWANAVGLAARRLGAYQRDKGLQAIVEAYVLGYTESELLAICDAAQQDDWVCGRGKDGRKKGLVGMTPDKLGELHHIAQEDAARKRKRDAKLKREREADRAERQREAESRAEPITPIDVKALFAAVPSTGFSRPSIKRPMTAEEIDRELERQQAGGCDG